MSLIEHYKLALQQPDMVHDKVQQQAIHKLDTLLNTLTSDSNTSFLHTISKYLPFSSAGEEQIKGLYLWGGVGRGKTWLMNMFYEELTIEQKTRIHFHHFMLDIHEQLANLNKQKGKKLKNPLKHIAKEIAKNNKVLCIDEFIVTNITDAMILSGLLQALFKYQVCLVATSNRIPDDLYLNGLQRDRFLPAIELIKTHTEVFHLNGGIDHRASLLEQADVYYHPINDTTEQQLTQRIMELAITPVQDFKTIEILGRSIKTVKCSDETIWFDFKAICTAPRAAQDYIEIAQQYSTVILSNIPILDEYSDDRARRFIYLIDELYDRNVKLIASAAAEPDNLYQGTMLEFAFHRTSSRLIEMRSHQYLNQTHKPF